MNKKTVIVDLMACFEFEANKFKFYWSIKKILDGVGPLGVAPPTAPPHVVVFFSTFCPIDLFIEFCHYLNVAIVYNKMPPSFSWFVDWDPH